MIHISYGRQQSTKFPLTLVYLTLFLLFLLVGIIGVWLVSGEPHRFLARRDAARAFRDSHSVELGTYEFFTRGIKAGMSEQEVDAQLLPADNVLRHMPDRTEPNSWNGFVNIYEYQYGTWHHPVLSVEKDLGKETIWVYFDHDGRAQKVYWSLHGEILERYWYLQPVDIDLATKKIDKR